ncbi:SGNH/GDSL hydrolase family protein [Candidatus Woesearchaeota archaeon]|nr:SGNH/GDSL hydrolase family protein [Candidatus Woesearchaeota archaeon]
MKLSQQINCKNALVFLITLITCLAIIEVSIRTFLPQDTNVYMYDSDFVFKFQPKATIHMRSPEYNVKTTFNTHGFRDKHSCYDKAKNSFRILLLGDSFTSGLEVDFEKIWGQLLEQQLKSQKFPVDVVNTGVNGWSTEQQSLFLKRDGIKYNPDLVILAYYIGNDQTDNILRNLFLFDGENLTLNQKKEFTQSRLRSVYYFLSSYSHTFNFFWGIYSKIKAKFTNNKPVKSLDPEYFINTYLSTPETEESKYAWSKTKALLKEIKQFLDNKNIPLLLVAIPDPLQEKELNINLNRTLPQKNLEKITQELDINYLDLLPHYENETNTHFKTDFHWNEKGHQIATEAIMKKLINENLISINNG